MNLKDMADGYFKEYNRKPKKTYTLADVTHIRDYAMKLLGETRISEYQQYLNNEMTRYGVVLSEFLNYVNRHPEFMPLLTSTENLESGDFGEAVKNGFEFAIGNPLKKIAEALGDAIGGSLGSFIKALLPTAIIVLVVYMIYVNRHKLKMS